MIVSRPPFRARSDFSRTDFRNGYNKRSPVEVTTFMTANNLYDPLSPSQASNSTNLYPISSALEECSGDSLAVRLHNTASDKDNVVLSHHGASAISQDIVPDSLELAESSALNLKRHKLAI